VKISSEISQSTRSAHVHTELGRVSLGPVEYFAAEARTLSTFISIVPSKAIVIIREILAYFERIPNNLLNLSHNKLMVCCKYAIKGGICIFRWSMIASECCTILTNSNIPLQLDVSVMFQSGTSTKRAGANTDLLGRSIEQETQQDYRGAILNISQKWE
jgi:hypothetical protein